MQEEARNCGCSNNNGCGCNNGGFLNGLFGGCGCGCKDSEILFFIIIFLLLFTSFGNNCGCGRN